MNFRTTYLLFGAVALLLVVFLLVLAFGPSGDADDYVLKSVRESIGKSSDKQKDAIKSITRVEIERLSPPGDTLVFSRSGDAWKLEAPYEAKVDSKLVEDMVTRLVEARIDRKADITPKLAALGLDSPSAVVTLRRGIKTDRITLGNVTPGSGAIVFALTGDRSKRDPVAIRKSDLEGLFREDAKDAATAGEALKSITDFRPRNLLAGGSPMAWDSVNRIHLKAGDKEIVIQKEVDGNWRFMKPEDYGPADPEGDTSTLGPAAENIAGVRPLLTLLTGLRIGDAADVVENPPKFDEFGLDEGKETLLVELGMKTGETDVLHFGKTTGDGKVAARLNKESFVVKFPGKAIDPVRKLLDKPMVMRDRNLLQFTPASVDAIDVKIHGEKKFELRLCGEPKVWRLYDESGGDPHELANSFAVQNLLNKLTERRTVKDFPDSKAGDAAYGLDVPSVEISLWQNGIIPEKKEEKKEDEKKDEPEIKKEEKPAVVKRPSLTGEPTVKLKFGRKEKDLVFVRRYVGTFSTLLAVPEGLVVAAGKPQVEYLDLLVPSFVRTQVIKLAVQRGPDRYEVEKEKGDPLSTAWKLTAPADQAGRAANADKIERTVLTLSALQPAKIVAARATDADLDRFGLKTPKAVFTVTVKDGKEAFTYAFGNETEDKKFYYARFGGKDRVYHMTKEVVDGLLEGDFQDTTIFRLDPARVKAVKMTGWKDVALDAVTLEFIRKNDKEWTVKDKADYAVDNDKFSAFLASLNLVRADRFVKGGPTPEQGLDVKAGALAIEITVEGEKDPITVTLGALEKDKKTYYATSNRSPGAVFLLFKDRFEKVREKPTYFKKM